MASLPSSPQQLAVAAGASVAIYWLWSYYTSHSTNQAPYPPGPTPLPLLGNILDMPLDKLPIGFTEFGQKYGPLTFLRVPGSNILVINSYEVATDLLDKRGTAYADRPRMVMMGELIGGDSTTILGRYGPGWKAQRKLLRQSLSANAVHTNYSGLLQRKWVEYAAGLVDAPEKFLARLTTMMAESVVDFSYGRHADDAGKSYMDRLYQIQEVIVKASFGYVVDLAPFLKHLPTWLPFMQFKRDAQRWAALVEEAKYIMFAQAKKDMEEQSYDAQPSYTVNNLKELYDRGVSLDDESNIDVEAIKSSAYSFYVAGAETTEVTFRAFLLAMLLHPSVQAQAHAELDRIVGRDRLPTTDDRESMPFLKATVLESLRWNPAGPVGVPHRLMQDDVYQNHFIPAGTTVFPCIWWMTRNPENYTNPTAFDPSRFLPITDPASYPSSKPILDPRQYVFGFGRRICPGNELALQSLWIGIATVLWAFEIRPDGEIDERLRDERERFTFGNIGSTIPFKCRFVPRFEGSVEKLAQY